MKEKIFQFSPLRIYNSSKSSRKTREITEFVQQRLDRRYFAYDEAKCNEIIREIRRECAVLNEKYPTTITIKVSVTNTNEWNDKDDWYLKVYTHKEGGFGQDVLSVLCFSVAGAVTA